MDELDRYRWSGHAVLMGRRRRGWQNRAEILVRFSTKKREAVSRYRQFVADGIALGRRQELTGVGLRRNAGGWEGLMELKRQGWDLKRLVTEVCRMLSVDPEDLQKKGRANSLSYAKGLIC